MSQPKSSHGNTDEAIIADAPSPLHLNLVEKYGSGPSIAQYRRRIEEHRLSNLKVLHRIPVQYTAPALTCAFDIDPVESNFLLCGSVQGSIDVINLNSTKERSPHDTAIPFRRQHRKMVTGLQWYSEDIGYFISCSRDNTVMFWDLNGQQAVDVFSIENPIQLHWNEINKKNPLIVVANKESNAKLIDLRDGSSLQQVRSCDSIKAVRWFPSNQHLLCCGDEKGSIKFWDIRSARPSIATHQISPSHSKIENIRFTSDGLWTLVTDTQFLYLFDAGTMKLHHKITLESLMIGNHPPERPRPIAIAEDGINLRVATSGTDGSITWITLPTNIPGRQHRVQILNDHFNQVTALHYRPESQELYSASQGMVLAFGSPGERARRSLISESNKRMVQDNWSDDE